MSAAYVVYSPGAKEDLREIYAYIAFDLHSPAIATKKETHVVLQTIRQDFCRFASIARPGHHCLSPDKGEFDVRGAIGGAANQKKSTCLQNYMGFFPFLYGFPSSKLPL